MRDDRDGCEAELDALNFGETDLSGSLESVLAAFSR